MRLTNEQLKRIIKEELEAVMDETLASYATDHMRQAEKDKPEYSVKVTQGNTAGEFGIYIVHPGGEFLVGSARAEAVKKWKSASEEQLKNFLSKRTKATMNEEVSDSYPIKGGEGPHDTKNFRRLSAYGQAGKNAQQIIRDHVAAGNYRDLNKYARYSSSMDLTKDNNEFGFKFDRNPEPKQLKRTQEKVAFTHVIPIKVNFHYIFP